MPVTKSATKKLKQDRKKKAFNLRLKKRVVFVIKSAEKNPTKENVRQAISIIDRATKKKIIHKNKSARLKSRISKLIGTKKQKTKRVIPKKGRK